MEEPLEQEQIGTLLGLVTHDLRNPLSALYANLDYLASTLGPAAAVDTETTEVIADLSVACDGLSHIIENLDLFASSMHQRGSSAPIGVELGPLIRQTLEGCQQVARSHELSLQAEPSVLSSGLSVQVIEAPFTSSLTNLVRNSIQHSRPGSSVCVSIEERGAEALIVVSDSGTLISRELAGQVFSAAGQQTLKRGGGGRYSRGLGLYIAGTAAVLAGARARATSDQATGRNRFELRAPLLKG